MGRWALTTVVHYGWHGSIENSLKTGFVYPLISLNGLNTTPPVSLQEKWLWPGRWKGDNDLFIPLNFDWGSTLGRANTAGLGVEKRIGVNPRGAGIQSFAPLVLVCAGVSPENSIAHSKKNGD